MFVFLADSSFDFFAWYSPLDSAFLGGTDGLNSISLVKRKLVVLSWVASRQPMDSDPFITSMEWDMKDEKTVQAGLGLRVLLC